MTEEPKPAPTEKPKPKWKPDISEKQQQLVRLCHRRQGAPRFILVSGPRHSTKTVGCCHAIVDHLWNVDRAEFACVAPTMTTADDAGFWKSLTNKVIPEYMEGKFGLKWVTKPNYSRTKKNFFEITNKHGTVSRCQLDSLQWEDDAEDKYKNKNYSGIYVSELSYYRKRATFDTLRQTLRGLGWQQWEFMFLADTNPAPEGQSHWAWQVWYDERLREDQNEDFKLWQKQLALMEFKVQDNVFMDAEWHRAQAIMYAHSEDLMARYYYGKWVTASGNSVFYDSFRPSAQIVGEHETPVNQDPEIIIPQENCTDLITGWDPGVSNSAFYIIEKVWILRHDRNGVQKEVSLFNFLDEVLFLNDERGLDEFVESCMEKITFWEQFMGRDIRWRNWSDRSAFDMRTGVANVYQHQLIRQMSEGKIILQAADRRPGSIRPRIELFKKLLYEDRIRICRSRCPHLIESLQGLPPGRQGAIINKLSHFKHAFDAASYAVCSECYDEVTIPREEQQRVARASEGLVCVPL